MAEWNPFKKPAPVEAPERDMTEQNELGARVLATLKEAAAKNKVYNLLDGKPDEGTGPMRVWDIENNAGPYSVVVDVGQSHQILQVDINLAEAAREIHVVNAPYGPDSWHPKAALGEVLARLSNEIAEYKMYKE